MHGKIAEVNILKEKGNASLKDGKYEEAVLHYTQAIKIDGKNHSLYSNRSLAFFKLKQFFFALEDAKEAIKLKPDWAKGYYRKGEVEYSTCNFNDALFSYTNALMLQPNESTIEYAIKKTVDSMKHEEASDDQISWIGAAIGIFIGASTVVLDHTLANKPTIVDPFSMVFLIFAIAVFGYGSAKGFRYYIKCQRTALLQPPIDLLKDQENKNDTTKKIRESRTGYYSKAKLRQKLKKQKM